MEFPPMKRRRLKVDDRFICLHQSELKRMKKKLFEMTKKALYLLRVENNPKKILPNTIFLKENFFS